MQQPAMMKTLIRKNGSSLEARSAAPVLAVRSAVDALADPVSYCLREDNQGCRKYEIRPLICRLFICCPHTERARQLIAAVNRLAEEDLVNWRNQRPDPANPFHGKFSYSQIRLRDCVSDALWHDLFTPEPHSRPA